MSNCFCPYIADKTNVLPNTFKISNKSHQKYCEITETNEGFNKALL